MHLQLPHFLVLYHCNHNNSAADCSTVFKFRTVSSRPLSDPVTFDLKHLQHFACDVMKLCNTFKRNQTICGGVIVITVFDLMTLNMF